LCIRSTQAIQADRTEHVFLCFGRQTDHVEGHLLNAVLFEQAKGLNVHGIACRFEQETFPHVRTARFHSQRCAPTVRLVQNASGMLIDTLRRGFYDIRQTNFTGVQVTELFHSRSVHQQKGLVPEFQEFDPVVFDRVLDLPDDARKALDAVILMTLVDLLELHVDAV
jgi:hypothetical protein